MLAGGREWQSCGELKQSARTEMAMGQFQTLRGPRVLVDVSTYQGLRHFGVTLFFYYLFLTHSQMPRWQTADPKFAKSLAPWALKG